MTQNNGVGPRIVGGVGVLSRFQHPASSHGGIAAQCGVGKWLGDNQLGDVFGGLHLEYSMNYYL